MFASDGTNSWFLITVYFDFAHYPLVGKIRFVCELQLVNMNFAWTLLLSPIITHKWNT